jgi:hypothetical protein
MMMNMKLWDGSRERTTERMLEQWQRYPTEAPFILHKEYVQMANEWKVINKAGVTYKDDIVERLCWCGKDFCDDCRNTSDMYGLDLDPYPMAMYEGANWHSINREIFGPPE